MEGNTKSPYVQGVWKSDRKLLTQILGSGKNTMVKVQEDTTIDLLQDLMSTLTLYAPAGTALRDVWIKNGIGTTQINTENTHRKTLNLQGGINKVALNISDIDPNTKITIGGALQDITITLPKTLGVQMRYKNRI